MQDKLKKHIENQGDPDDQEPGLEHRTHFAELLKKELHQKPKAPARVRFFESEALPTYTEHPLNQSIDIKPLDCQNQPLYLGSLWYTA